MYAKNIKLFVIVSLFTVVLSSFLCAASMKNYFSTPTLASNGDNIFNITGTWKIGATAVTATAADLNSISTGIVSNSIFSFTTSSATVKTGKVFGIADNGALQIAGTAVTSTAAELNILDGVTATAAELNKCDISLQTEVITTTDTAISVTKRVSNLETTAGGALTLAAPDATMIGQVKTIQMTADNGDVTLALTNVQGQTSGTTATFNSVDDTLVLVAGKNKWNVIAEVGIVLS